MRRGRSKCRLCWKAEGRRRRGSCVLRPALKCLGGKSTEIGPLQVRIPYFLGVFSKNIATPLFGGTFRGLQFLCYLDILKRNRVRETLRFWPNRVREIVQKMRIKLGEVPCSQSSDKRLFPSGRKRRKLAPKRNRKTPLQKWRCSLSRRGRAVWSAIDRARSLIKKKRIQRREPTALTLEPGKLVSYLDLSTESTKECTVFMIQKCNEDKKVTNAWVLFERGRRERNKDRRLCRFVAAPVESCSVVSLRK